MGIPLEASEGSQVNKSFGNSLDSSKERILFRISLEILKSFSLAVENNHEDINKHIRSK